MVDAVSSQNEMMNCYLSLLGIICTAVVHIPYVLRRARVHAQRRSKAKKLREEKYRDSQHRNIVSHLVIFYDILFYGLMVEASSCMYV